MSAIRTRLKEVLSRAQRLAEHAATEEQQLGALDAVDCLLSILEKLRGDASDKKSADDINSDRKGSKPANDNNDSSGTNEKAKKGNPWTTVGGRKDTTNRKSSNSNNMNHKNTNSNNSVKGNTSNSKGSDSNNNNNNSNSKGNDSNNSSSDNDTKPMWTTVVRRNAGNRRRQGPQRHLCPEQFCTPPIDADDFDCHQHGTIICRCVDDARIMREAVKERLEAGEKVSFGIVADEHFGEATRTVLKLVDGRGGEPTYADKYVLSCGDWTLLQEVKSVTLEHDDTTCVVVGTVAKRYTDAATWEQMTASPGAALPLACQARCKEAGIPLLARHLWGIKRRTLRMENGEVLEILLRVRKADCDALLRKSGEKGLFFKALKFREGKDIHRVLWFNRTVRYERALQFCAKFPTSTLGLILGQGGGLGVRLEPNVDSASVIDYIGADHLAPMLDPDMKKYTVLGVHHHELLEDILTSLRKMPWNCMPVARYGKQGSSPTRIIVAAASEPPFTRVCRGKHRDPLVIRQTSSRDQPRHKAELYKGGISLPKAAQKSQHMPVDDPLPPGSPKKMD